MAVDTARVADWSWKIATAILFPIMFSLAGWVWTTNTKITNLSNDLEDAQEDLVELKGDLKEVEEEADQVATIHKDIEFIKTSLERIEKSL